MYIITGDTHRDFRRVFALCDKFETTLDDVLIVLGDAGINYFGGTQDREFKKALAGLPIELFCIHGNHECRPETIGTYQETTWRGGKVFVESTFPNLRFAKDGEVYDIAGRKCIAIGGAYSIDKHLRIANNRGWWPDEQPSDETKHRVEKRLASENWRVDAVFSHTCPLKYEPREVFLKGIDESAVDNSTETWLDTIENRLDYDRWYCGHYHTNKIIDKMCFLFDGFVELCRAESEK